MADSKKEAGHYKYRSEMEKMLLGLGAAFVGILNALVKVDQASPLRIGLAVACAFLLVAFVAFLFLHAMRILNDQADQPKTFTFLVWLVAISGMLGVLSLFFGFIADTQVIH